MYIKRNIDNYLLQWKTETKRKPLLLRGARQVGKSSSVKEFAKGFEYFLEINFEEDKKVHEIFDGNLSPKQICRDLSLMYDVSIIPGQTLIFFDEIQSCIPAILSLRFFYEKMPEQHLVAAGSLLEFALQELPSFGVGRIRSLFVYPLSFDEFLSALGNKSLLQAKTEASELLPLSKPVHNRIIALFKEFLIIGGMPEVVANYIETNDVRQCQRVLDDLIISLQADFAKYKKRIPSLRIRKVFESVTKQSGQKFVYANAVTETSSKQTQEALELLVMANLIFPVTHTSANGLPLGAEANIKRRKMILLDTGLTQRLLNLQLVDILLSQDFEVINKGNIAEQYVGLELMKNASPYQPQQLYYWHREARNSNAEVDYIIQVGNKIIPLEVKSGIKGKMHSLRLFLKEKNTEYGYRISLENYASFENIKVLPLYAVSRLNKENETRS